MGLLSLAAACQSDETKRMQSIAGSYAWDYESEPAPGHQEPFLHERFTLILRPDGRWTSAHLAEINGEAQPQSLDSGSYRVQGVTLTTGATELGPAQQYTISGDTLWIRTAAQAARAKAITGLDMSKGNSPGFLIRQQ
jgi:hypothetical protein